ncbi:hypothetical protein BDAP_000996 [Binucleata daphniae]
MDPVCEFISLLNSNSKTYIIYNKIASLPLCNIVTKSFYDYNVFFDSLKTRKCTCNLNCGNYYSVYKQKSFKQVVHDYENLKFCLKNSKKLYKDAESKSFENEYLDTIIKAIDNIKTDEDLYLIDYSISDLYKKHGELELAKEVAWNGILQCRVQNNAKGIIIGKAKLDDK